jgi:archaellum component FlaF (FlaF/FlaG flagellin family)
MAAKKVSGKKPSIGRPLSVYKNGQRVASPREKVWICPGDCDTLTVVFKTRPEQLNVVVK